jgi:hypothetical protein
LPVRALARWFATRAYRRFELPLLKFRLANQLTVSLGRALGVAVPNPKILAFSLPPLIVLFTSWQPVWLSLLASIVQGVTPLVILIVLWLSTTGGSWARMRIVGRQRDADRRNDRDNLSHLARVHRAVAVRRG